MVKSIFAIVYHLCNCIYFIYLTRIIAGLDLFILSLGRRYNTFSHNVTGEQRKRSLLRHPAVNSFVSRFVTDSSCSRLSRYCLQLVTDNVRITVPAEISPLPTIQHSAWQNKTIVYDYYVNYLNKINK